MKKQIATLFLALAFSAAGQITNVNIGSAANDGTGDPLRTALAKLNANDNWLATNIVTPTDATNIAIQAANAATNGFGDIVIHNAADFDAAGAAQTATNPIAAQIADAKTNATGLSSAATFAGQPIQNFVTNAESAALLTTNQIVQKNAHGSVLMESNLTVNGDFTVSNDFSLYSANGHFIHWDADADAGAGAFASPSASTLWYFQNVGANSSNDFHINNAYNHSDFFTFSGTNVAAMSATDFNLGNLALTASNNLTVLGDLSVAGQNSGSGTITGDERHDFDTLRARSSKYRHFIAFASLNQVGLAGGPNSTWIWSDNIPLAQQLDQYLYGQSWSGGVSTNSDQTVSFKMYYGGRSSMNVTNDYLMDFNMIFTNVTGIGIAMGCGSQYSLLINSMFTNYVNYAPVGENYWWDGWLLNSNFSTWHFVSADLDGNVEDTDTGITPDTQPHSYTVEQCYDQMIAYYDGVPVATNETQLTPRLNMTAKGMGGGMMPEWIMYAYTNDIRYIGCSQIQGWQVQAGQQR